MLRIAAGRLGLTEGVEYDFKCVSFSTLIESMTQPDGPCSAAASGITITSERQALGIQFTCGCAARAAVTSAPLRCRRRCRRRCQCLKSHD